MSAAAGLGKRVGVDWAKILNKCNPTVRKAILDIRAHHEDLRRRIAEHKASPATATLDWDYYKARLEGTEWAALLAELKDTASRYRPKKTDIAGQLAEVDAQRTIKLGEAADYLTALEGDIAKLRAHLEVLRNAKPVDELTTEDMYAAYPQYREEIYQAIRENNWAVGPDGNGPAAAHPPPGK